MGKIIPSILEKNSRQNLDKLCVSPISRVYVRKSFPVAALLASGIFAIKCEGGGGYGEFQGEIRQSYGWELGVGMMDDI